MLSGEGNAGERWKTTIGLISKKATLLVQKCSTLFLYISLPLFCTTSMWNFQKLLCYTLFTGNVVRVFVHLFFHCRSFSPCILFATCISHFVTAATKFSCCSSNKKKCLLCFFFRVELRWPAAYFLFFFVFLLLYILNLWIWQLIY